MTPTRPAPGEKSRGSAPGLCAASRRAALLVSSSCTRASSRGSSPGGVSSLSPSPIWRADTSSAAPARPKWLPTRIAVTTATVADAVRITNSVPRSSSVTNMSCAAATTPSTTDTIAASAAMAPCVPIERRRARRIAIAPPSAPSGCRAGRQRGDVGRIGARHRGGVGDDDRDRAHQRRRSAPTVTAVFSTLRSVGLMGRTGSRRPKR